MVNGYLPRTQEAEFFAGRAVKNDLFRLLQHRRAPALKHCCYCFIVKAAALARLLQSLHLPLGLGEPDGNPKMAACRRLPHKGEITCDGECASHRPVAADGAQPR